MSDSPGPWTRVSTEEVWQRVTRMLTGGDAMDVPCPRCDGRLHVRRDETVLRGERAERRLKAIAVRCAGACTRDEEAALALYHFLALQPPRHPLVRLGRRPGTFLT